MSINITQPTYNFFKKSDSPELQAIKQKAMSQGILKTNIQNPGDIKPTNSINFGGIAQAAAGPASALIGNVLSGGLNSGVGNALQELGSIASAIPGPWGAAASAGLNILGGVTNKLFGAKFNDENIANIQSGIDAARGYQLDSNMSLDQLANEVASSNQAMDFTNKYVGTDGLFSNKVAKKANALRQAQDTAFAWQSNVQDNAIRNATMNSNQQLQSTFAYGGGINIKPSKRGTFTRAAKKHNMGVQEFANHVLNNKENYSNAMIKKANFAKNAAGWKHAFGGDLMTNGADFSNGIYYIDEGGTHEQNPNQGVLMGMTQDGTPNLVEEGEVIKMTGGQPDYVFPHRLKLSVNRLKDYGIKSKKAMPISEVAMKISKESEERPNDPISIAGREHFLNMLIQDTEEKRLQEEQKKMRQAYNNMTPSQQAEVLMAAQQQQQQEAYNQELAQQEQEQQQQQEGLPPYSTQFAQGGHVNLFKGPGDKPQWLNGLQNIVNNIVQGLNPQDFVKTYYSRYPGGATAKYNSNIYGDWNNFQFNGEHLYNPQTKQYANIYKDPRFIDWLKSDEGLQYAKDWWGNPKNAQNYFLRNKTAPTIDELLGKDGVIGLMYDAPTGNTSAFSDAHKYGMDALKFWYNKLNPQKQAKPKYGDRYYTYTLDQHGMPQTALISDYNTWSKDPNNSNWLYDPSKTKTGVVDGDTTYTDHYFIQKPASQERDNAEVNPIKRRPEWLRYASGLGLAAGTLTDFLGITNKPDYGNFADINASLNNSRIYQPVEFNKTYNYLPYTPIDIQSVANQIEAQSAGAQRAIINNSGANRASALAGILSNNYNTIGGIGDAIAQVNKENLQNRIESVKQATTTDQFNSQGQLDADKANQAALNANRWEYTKNLLAAAEARQKIKDTSDAAKAANLSGLLKFIGDLGYENMNRNMMAGLIESGAPVSDDVLKYWGYKTTKNKNKQNG